MTRLRLLRGVQLQQASKTSFLSCAQPVGRPCRPLLWHWPEDSAAIAADDPFLLGPDLLVAPVLDEGTTRRRVYFPAQPDGWIDFHDGSAYAGGQAHDVPGPLGRLPLFVRAGAVLPLAGEGSETDG